jgi:RNA polymerase sigma-70 factor (family 1)
LAPRTHDTDPELFERIASGDEAAFTVIYLRYTQKLLPHIKRLLNSELWAEEIVQDVFVKLWEVRHTLALVENPSAFIYSIAGNKAIDVFRHRAVEIKTHYRMARNLENEGAELVNPTEVEYDYRISDRLLKEAVNGLSPQKQLIYRLKHENGYTYDQIASELMISRNTVRNHLADALKIIRRYLLQQGVLAWILLFFY